MNLAATAAAPRHDPSRDPLDGLDDLVRQHQAGVWRFLRALGADAALAEELAQDVFLLAWQKRIVAQAPGETAAWLLRTARFLWLRQLRQRRWTEARVTAHLLEWWLRQGATAAGERWLEALQECRRQLAPKAAQALELVYADGRGREDAAAALGMTPNGFKTLMQRTRQLLRTCIERRLG